MRSGHIARAQTERPPGAGAQGLHPTRRLQLPVLAGRRRVRGPGAALGQLRATPHFLVLGARAGTACTPASRGPVLSVFPPASSFPEDSGSRAGTRGLGFHGGLALPSSGGELRPQSTSGETPERGHLGAAALTEPGCPACVRWWWEGWLLCGPSCPYASRGPYPVPPAVGKAGGGRGLPRPLRHPSGRRCDSSHSNGPGCGQGAGPAGPEVACCFPALQAAWSPQQGSSGGNVVSTSRKKATGGSEDGLLWRSSAGGDLDGLFLILSQIPEHQIEGQLPSSKPPPIFSS